MANSPNYRLDIRPDSPSRIEMSQGREGFGASQLDSEGGRDSPFSDMSANDSNINRNSNGDLNKLSMFTNYHPTPPDHSGFSAIDSDILGSNALDASIRISNSRRVPLTHQQEVWRTISVPNLHPNGLSHPVHMHQSARTPSPDDFIPFPRIPSPSEYQEFDPGTPILMAFSPHVQHLKVVEQALSANVPSQTSGALPRVHFGHPFQPPDLPLLPPTLPQPPPSGPPYTSSSFDQSLLPNGAAVTAHLRVVVWRPSMGMHGVPTTEAQKSYYVRKISLSLVNLYNLWDDPKDLLSHAVKFADTGIWSGSKDIESAAHIIVNNAIRIHNFGVTGAAFRQSEQFESLNAEDIDFTFPQRIHYLARLFYHSKVAADNVMSDGNIAKYVALPITSLRRLPMFEDEWSRMSKVDRVVETEILPYPNGLEHPSREEQGHLMKRVRLLPSLLNNYMMTGGHLATFGQKYLSLGELAYAGSLSSFGAYRKRAVDRNQGSGMEPDAKRSCTSVPDPLDSSFQDSPDEEGPRADKVMDTGSATRGS